MPQQFPIIEHLRNNSLLSGLRSGLDLYKQVKMMPNEFRQAEISNLLNEQKQQQQEMYLQKYPELLAAELSKAQLEPDEMRSRTALMGGQLKQLEQELKYKPELFSAETAERRAKAEDLTRRNQLIQRLLGGGLDVPQGTSVGSYGKGFAQPESIQRHLQGDMQQTSGIPQRGSGTTNMTYAQAALLSDQLGLPKPEVRDIDGQLIGISAFGNFPIAAGMSQEEKSFKQTMGSERAKAYSDLSAGYQSLSNQDIAIDELIDLSKDPEFRSITGPVKSFITKWSGNPEKQELLGRLQSASGEITLQVAPSLKGAFTGKDQALIGQIKANPKTDFPDIFIGKLKSQKLINTVLKDRSDKAANYMEQGLSQREALKRATQETPLDNYRSQVEDMINPVRATKTDNGKTYYLRANGKVYSE